MERTLFRPIEWQPFTWTLVQAIALMVLVTFGLMFVTQVSSHPEGGIDAHAYWSFDLAAPYVREVATPDAFLYSPAFAQAMLPLRALPFEVFYGLLTVGQMTVYVLLVGPVLAMIGLLLPPEWAVIVQDLRVGNIHLLMAGALVVGFRWPGAWAFLLLTKVTPGVAGVYFLVRREWRQFWEFIGVSAAIVAVSFIIAPNWWGEWLALLASSESGGLAWRLVAAVGIVAIAGLRGWRWLVPFGVTLAVPVLWLNALTVLVAVVPLARKISPSSRHLPCTEPHMAARKAS